MIDIERLVELLRAENPAASRDHILAVADWLLLWADASRNVRRFGSVVLDPKTANRIENPKLKIKEKAEKALFKKPLSEVRRRNAMRALEESIEEEAKDENGAGERGTEELRERDEAVGADPNAVRDDGGAAGDPDPMDGHRQRKKVVKIGPPRKSRLPKIPRPGAAGVVRDAAEE